MQRTLYQQAIIFKMSPCRAERFESLSDSSSYSLKGNENSCIFLSYFLYPLQLFQNVFEWVKNSSDTNVTINLKKPIQQDSQKEVLFETSNHKDVAGYKLAKTDIEEVQNRFQKMNTIKEGNDQVKDIVERHFCLFVIFLENLFSEHTQTAKLAENNSQTNESKDNEPDTVSDYGKTLRNEKNTLLKGSETISDKKAVENSLPTCDNCQGNDGVNPTNKKEPEFRRFSGKNTSNVKKNGEQVETAGKSGNSGTARNATPFHTSSRHAGMGNGGSDGGDEPHIRDNSLPCGHYEESPVPQLNGQDTSNHPVLMPVGIVNGDIHDNLPSTHIRDRNNDSPSNASIGINTDPVNETVGGQSDVDVAQDGNLKIRPNTNIIPAVSVSPYNLDLSGQACYASKLDVEFQGQTSHESMPPQTILSPLSKELSVQKDGTYREGDDYTTLGFAGAGGFGTCEFCEDKEAGFMFVRKKMKKSEYNKNEIISMTKLNNSLPLNRNILKFLGAIAENEHVLLFMECMSGSLADIANIHDDFPLSEDDVVVIIKVVLQGLGLIHEKLIVHGDIKCANIFFNADTFDIKIGDLGSSQSLNLELVVDDTKLCGTVQCMPREVCRSEPYGRSADMWSVACAIIHLLTGCMPLSEFKTRQTVIFKVGSGQYIPEIPATCSPQLKQVLRRLLLDPTGRPTAKELLCDPIFTMPDDIFEQKLAGIFGRILEYQLSLSSDLVDEFVVEWSPMSLSGPNRNDDENVSGHDVINQGLGNRNIAVED